ncbi:MAG: PDZ domain-containing protein [Candidatus Omnitrophica bacterium]|nr:PDZ domain-containing protein [Candidatus Omnitrophota bacterium]
MNADKLERLRSFPYVEAAIALVVVVVLGAMFIDTRHMAPQSAPRLAQTSGSNAIEFDVITVNPIIAKDFNLPYAAGVLINSEPKGAARRLFDLTRGDVILKYNNVDVQSAHHLAFLMSSSKPGDTVQFVVSRNGKMLTINNKIPAATGLDIFAPEGRNIAIALVIILVTFAMISLNLFDRTVCAILGAVVMLVAGSLFGFYKQSEAFDAIKMSPIFIFLGMGVFAVFLEDLRFFQYATKRMIVFFKADKVRILMGLCVMTFLFSMFAGSLRVMILLLVMIPITIYAARTLMFDPVPVVIFEIIAANIGSTATAIGGFANMQVASVTGITFLDFLIYLLPITIVCFLASLAYMWFTEFRQHKILRSVKQEKVLLLGVEHELEGMHMDWPAVKMVLYVLGAVIAAFFVLPVFRIQLAPIALGGAFLLLAIEHHKARHVIRKVRLIDAIYYIAIFIIVGGAVYSGLLNNISDILMSISAGNKVLYPIFLLWFVAAFTILLNPGAAAAFFIPVVMHSGFADFTDVVWWALSLGVMVGSCTCLTPASGGVITHQLTEELHVAKLDGRSKEGLTFASYNRRGLPISLILLVISTAYIFIICNSQ